MSAKEIWDTLSKVDVSSHIDKKGSLSYLSWAWAWGVLMKHYPQAVYNFLQTERAEDGTTTVYCEVTIDDVSRLMWLPVMDHRNNAIANPDARKISDTKMRCLTKCLAMFGLGHYIYAGEDLPEQEPTPLVSQEKIDHIISVIDNGTAFDFYSEIYDLSSEDQEFIFSHLPKGTKTAIKARWRDRTREAFSLMDDLAVEVSEAIKAGDDLKIKEELEDLSKPCKIFVWNKFTPEEQTQLKEILK